MISKNTVLNINDYVNALSDDRKLKISGLLNTINSNIPEGFENTMNYGMIGWVVPQSLYPAGYHCDPKLPLPFMNLASQKNFIALYHMGIYAIPELFKWFNDEYFKILHKKPDMGKSCIRLKDKDKIPYELIGDLAKKLSPFEWIKVYESHFK